MRVRRWLVRLVMLSLCAAIAGRCGVARADAQQEAARLVAEAKVHFSEKDYAAAAAKLVRAHALEPNPMYLFNAGQSLRKGGRPKEALALYERFVSTSPTHRLVGEARNYISDLQGLLEAQKRGEEVQLQLDAERQERTKTAEELEQERQTLEKTRLELEKAKNPPVYKKGWFWAALAGVVFTGIAVAGITLNEKAVAAASASEGGDSMIKFTF